MVSFSLVERSICPNAKNNRKIKTMSARLKSSFRFGNLAEHLGLLLLKGVAAVAEVARPEDIGVDAIASLLRRDADGNCYAEETFLVQIKSNLRPIQYRGHQLDWFLKQEQPFFVGVVSLAKSQISLYPTVAVNHAVNALHAKWVTLHFGPSHLPPFLRGQEWGGWTGDSDQGAKVWLGHPLLTWTLSNLSDGKWEQETYTTLKRYLAIARRELELLSLGQTSVLNWSTNCADSITSQPGMMKGAPDDLPTIARRLGPCLRAIMLRAFSMPPEPGNRLMLPAIELITAIREMGVDVEIDGLFEKLCFPPKHQLVGQEVPAVKS